MKEECQNCRFWRREADTSLVGECFLRPPVPLINIETDWTETYDRHEIADPYISSSVIHARPKTHAKDFCKEFEENREGSK